MISASLEILNFLFGNFEFLFSLIVFTILSIVLAKSIKRNAKVYYWVFGILSSMFIVPMIGRWTGLFSFSFYYFPIIGNIVSEFASLAYMGHPLFVIIMYMGALSTKNKKVGRLMSIRKELSIIVGFPVIAHTLKRILTFVWALGFYTDRETFMENPYFVSELAAGISSNIYILGIVMFVLFMVLWVTSFDGVRKKMGFKKWKAVQRWSYGLYAMLFIQAAGIQLSAVVNEHVKKKMAAQTELMATVDKAHNNEKDNTKTAEENKHKVDKEKKKVNEKEEKKRHGRSRRKSLDDAKMSVKTASSIRLSILVAIYGSYLVLRIRKAKRLKKRKRK